MTCVNIFLYFDTNIFFDIINIDNVSKDFYNDVKKNIKIWSPFFEKHKWTLTLHNWNDESYYVTGYNRNGISIDNLKKYYYEKIDQIYLKYTGNKLSRSCLNPTLINKNQLKKFILGNNYVVNLSLEIKLIN